MKYNKIRIVFLLGFSVLVSSPWAHGAAAEQEAAHNTGEFSAMIGYSKTNFGNSTYSTTRRYAISIAYNITPVTEIELSYTDTKSFFNYDPIQTTLVKEQALSVSAIQALVPPQWIVQPYGKLGAAQYNRQQSGTVSGVPTIPTSSKSPSAVLGAGVRVFFLRNFSLKVEGVTYIPDLKFSELKNNFSITGGAGWHF